MGWLEGAGQTHRLTQPRRTHQQGLLAAALAVREGRDVKTALTASTFNNRTTWKGVGFHAFGSACPPECQFTGFWHGRSPMTFRSAKAQLSF